MTLASRNWFKRCTYCSLLTHYQLLPIISDRAPTKSKQSRNMVLVILIWLLQLVQAMPRVSVQLVILMEGTASQASIGLPCKGESRLATQWSTWNEQPVSGLYEEYIMIVSLRVLLYLLRSQCLDGVGILMVKSQRLGSRRYLPQLGLEHPPRVPSPRR